MMVLGRTEHNLKLIKKLVFVLILFVFFFSFNTNVKAAIVNIGDTENYGYTGDVQTFTAPYTGVYKLKTWGAQGGSTHGFAGGGGGYSEGNVYLHEGDTLYIYVGGQGSAASAPGESLTGGFNGGGSVTGDSSVNHYTTSGGGATHIATVSGLLSTLENQKDKILIVSGGGGGATWQENYDEFSAGARQGPGGSGGGSLGIFYLQTGVNSWIESTWADTTLIAGTQTAGYAFGQGASNTGGSAGGGGFYGGKTYQRAGAGGSGYVGNPLLTDKHMTMYATNSDYNNTKTNPNTSITTAASETPTDDTPKAGWGYAKVTFLGNNDTTLKTLTVSGYEIMPALRSDKRDYVVFVNENETSLTLNAETNDSKASVTYNSTITIAEDTTTETLTVTAEDGTVGIYTLNIYKQIPSDMGGEYAYTGDVQTFTATKGGLYKLETWGAQGGNANSTYIGGYGGYSTGVVKLKKGETVYIYVGQGGVSLHYPEKPSAPESFNGGGYGVAGDDGLHYNGSGGGATHIATTSGELKRLSSKQNEVLIVASGGGGAYYHTSGYYGNGGAGGGIKGNDGTTDTIVSRLPGQGGTQTAGGDGIDSGKFGRGGNNAAGGGGGWYGGGASGGASTNHGLNGAGGGSSYIGSTRLTTTDQVTKHMTCYNCATSDDESTKTISNTCHSSAATADCAKEGDGYARIMFIEEYNSDATLSFLSVTNYELDKKFNSNKYEYSLPTFEETVENIEINATPNDYNATVSGDGIINVPYGKSTHEIIVTAQDGTIGIYKIKLNREATPEDEYSYNYTGDVQEFIAPVTGKYKLETWGAQGGSVDNTYTGGYGAYSTGTISLKANQKVYIYVGGEGQTTTNGYSESVAGGYNGGGSANTSNTSCSSATQYKSSGGGATHMATTSGLLNTLENNKSNILIVSAGGGGGSLLSDDSCYNQHSKSNGGSGAGYKSKVESFEEIDYQENYTCYPATQNSSGYCTYNSETKGPGSFGVGGSYVIGGGGGYYGGASGTDKKSQGGVSYIGNTKLIDKHMTCYNCETSSEESTKTSSTACFSISPKEDCAKRGNGYARITPLGIESEDATLKSLTVTNQELKQAFDPERLNYDLILDEDATSVEITAEANDEKASLTYNQNVELTSNPQLEQITVTAEDGTINVYSINIKRVKAAYLKPGSQVKGVFYQVKNSNNSNLREATLNEYNTIKESLSNDNVISLPDSPYPAYSWAVNDEILYYSEADIIYLNPDCEKMFNYSTQFLTEIDLSGFDSSKVTNMHYMFLNSGATKINLNNFDTSNVTDMYGMFYGCNSLTELDLSSFDTSNVTDMSYMFVGCRTLETLDLSSFNTSKVTSMYGMFQFTTNLKTLDVSSFNTSNVTNMSYMFMSSGLESLDLSSFDTSNVTDMESMFREANITELDLSGFDVSKVSNFQMFGQSNIRKINISGWKFKENASLERMFNMNSKLESIIMDNVDTSGVTSMKMMFNDCSSLKSLDLSSFDTSNVTDMSYMFNNCKSLETLDLSNFNTSKVTNMRNMFSGGNNIMNLKNINMSGFDVHNVTDMYGMFNNCGYLTELDLSSFDVSNVIDMRSMFQYCSSLKSIDLSNFYSPNLKYLDNAFSSCGKLETIYSNDLFTTENVIDNNYVFYLSSKIKGGQGTIYNYSHIGKEYARVDDPDNGKPGYFTYKEFKPKIYYPDDTFEEVQINYEFTFPETWQKDSENISLVTFKYQNGEEDTVANVTKLYDFNKWKIYDTEYEPNSTLNIMVDTYLEALYNETIQSAVFPDAPTSEHATFIGWYTEPTSGEEVTSYNGEEDITLYAHWDAEDMTVSFEENGGEEISDITISYGSEIGELPTTIKTGFILEGWYSDEELTNKVLSSTVVNDNMTLYAKWIEDDFPIVYQDDEEVFDGTNYLNTHIKLYNEENISKDYEIGFTIEEFDESIQEQYATFVQDKYELESAGYPGLLVRLGSEDSVLKTNIAHRRTEDDRNYIYIDNYPVVKKVRIVRKDNTIYYSVNDGELSVLHNFNNFTNYFETEATFGAALDENNSPYRFLKGKLSNMYIRLGEAHEDHMVTYPDGNVEIYPHNTIITLGTNNSSKASEEGATVTFKYHNGLEDTTSRVTTKYTANGFKIDDTHYDNSSTLLVDSDKVIEYDYDKLVSTTFPVNPTKEDEIFKGWYTEEDGGEKVTSYNGENDITLHARYAIDEATMMKGTVFKAKITALGDFKYFRKATEAEYNLVKSTLTDDNIVSDTNSPNEIYLWISGDNCLFYSEASNVYLNENSDSLFYNINGVEEIDISDLNTSRVTNMGHLFYNLPNLRSVDLTNIDTSNVTNMDGMFYGDKKLESLDLSDFVTDNVKDFGYLFYNCETLTELDLSNFNTSNATDMANMFVGTKNITTLDLSNFDTKNVSNMIGMFTGMSKLKNLDISSFDTSNITDMTNMFNNCSSLEQLDISSFDTSRVRNFFQAFYGDQKLNTIFVSNKWTTANIGTAYNSGMNVFTFAYDLIGQEGTEYDSQHKNVEYAHIDEGETNPGYLTDVSHKGEVHSVTFPDGTVEMKPHNTVIRFSRNLPAADKTEELGTVTFKYHNGNEDTTSTVVKNYTQNAYKVNNVHQDYNTGTVKNPNDANTVSIRVNEDKVIEYDFDIETTGAEFPTDPTKENYIFTGWYTEEENGEKVESLDNIDGDITLHAHFVKEMVTITTPNETIEVPKGEDYTLPTNDIDKVNDMVSTVTFKYHNDVDEDLTRNVEKQYTVNGWLINDTHYDDEEIINPTEDITLVPDYIDTVIGVEFPDKPKKDNLAFTGWYDEETGGNKYTSYSEEEDIVLHAQYTDDIITINIPGEEPEIIPNGEEYELPNNIVEKDSEEVATVTFKLHNEEEDIVRNVIKEYTPNGWLINGVHYNDGDTITPTEDITLVPDYTESLVGVEFPNNPTKDEDVFIGWYDEETGGNKYTSYNEEEDIELHAQYDSNYAYLKEGTLIFEHVSKSLTGEFRKATEEEYNEVKDTLTSDNIISDDTSRVPVYMWESDSNVYYYSEASIIFTNVNSKSMFEGAQFSSIDLSGLNTSKTEDMSFMFNNCSQATSINVSNFDTSNVTTMYYMFTNSRRLTSLDISSFDTRNVNNMSYAFAFLQRLSSLNVSNLNTSKVQNMNSIFSGDSNLYELDLSTWDTSNVNDMSNMFNGCSRIASLNLYNLDISNVRTFYNMFNEMSNLKSITMSNYYNRKVTNMYNMFQGCKNLQTVDISNINAKGVENISYAFSRTNKLTTIYATKNAWPVLENGQGDFVFATAPLLVGGQGTAYDSSKINKTYAIVDDPDNGNPGYFTDASTIRTQHNVTFHYYTGDVVEKHNHDTIMTLEENNSSKPVEVLGTITFKYHDDETDDSTLDIIKSYSNNGWLVNGVHYDDEGKVVIDEDKEVNYDYLSTSTGAELPTPTRDGFDFDGWYTEETGGEKVESYEGTEDIVLHAHWSSTYPTDMTIDSDDVTIVVGETHQIEVTFTPDGTEDTVTYTGYDGEKISIVDGLVTGLAKGETTITVGTENTNIEKTITVTIISDKLESDVYEVRDKTHTDNSTSRIIIGAEVGTTLAEFKDNLLNPNEYIKIFDSNDNELEDDVIVMTGQIIKIVYGNNVMDEAIIVVRGDLNGDGFVNVMDDIVITNSITDANPINEISDYPRFAAADLEEDDFINVVDEIKMLNFITDSIDSLNN